MGRLKGGRMGKERRVKAGYRMEGDWQGRLMICYSIFFFLLMALLYHVVEAGVMIAIIIVNIINLIIIIIINIITGITITIIINIITGITINILITIVVYLFICFRAYVRVCISACVCLQRHIISGKGREEEGKTIHPY